MDITTYLIRTTVLVTVGVVLANLALERNTTDRLSSLIKPMSKALNLPQMCVFSIITCFFSPTAGKSALSGFYREGKIGDKETILTIVMSTFPTVLGESLLRVQAPIALVLLGPKIGGIYILLGFFSSFLQSFAAFVYSKFFLPPRVTQEEIDINNLERAAETTPNLKMALKKSFATLKKVVPIMIITFLIIALLMEFGGMNYISLLFDPILKILGLPGECITALISQIIHFSAGYSTVAMLLAEGIITEKQAIITLLIGSMMVITLIYIRYSFSMYVSLFGKFGMRITVINYLSSLLSKMMMILLVMAVM